MAMAAGSDRYRPSRSVRYTALMGALAINFVVFYGLTGSGLIAAAITVGLVPLDYVLGVIGKRINGGSVVSPPKPVEPPLPAGRVEFVLGVLLGGFFGSVCVYGIVRVPWRRRPRGRGLGHCVRRDAAVAVQLAAVASPDTRVGGGP